jgi:hypothetical protein
MEGQFFEAVDDFIASCRHTPWDADTVSARKEKSDRFTLHAR